MANPLAAKLAAEIESSGPIGFERFMAAALYDPEYGYYMGAGNPELDYRTAVDTHPLFAAMFARHLDRAWHELGCPEPFWVVELGSGPGSMAASVFRIARELPWGSILDWTGVEIGPSRRRAAQLSCPRGRFISDLMQLKSGSSGVVFANEYLDAVPFKLAQRDDSGWLEKRVGVSEGGTLVFVEASAEPDLEVYCRRWADAIPVGGMIEARTDVDSIFSELATKFQRLKAIFVDYGGSSNDVHSLRYSSGTALAYRGMQVSEDLLAEPGFQDLTAHVNFDAVSDCASRHGFRRRQITTQAQYLIDLGIGSYLPTLAEGPAPDRSRYEAERDAVSRLLDPRQMGSFKVLELEFGPDVARARFNPRR
ncbi:MAG: SAM-dependent methyltransferase [Chloroflexota bacterium]|nr:SAM-dependent methyltransferase [Chloroflexota bacterium]